MRVASRLTMWASGGAVWISLLIGSPTSTAADAGRSAAAFDVTDFGAVGDGRTKATAPLQRAIDAAHQAGGGTVYFPPGSYLSGTLLLRSNVTLHLENGATLLGSTDLADYPHTIPQIRSYTDNYVYQSLLYGENVRQVGIVGQGAIDGQGGEFSREHPSRQYGERPYLVRLISSQAIRVSGVTMRNSPMWVQHYLACDNVTIDGVTVHSLVNSNNDGIDIDGCHDVRIANCSIVSGDDAIVLKSTLDRSCRNVTVANCVLSTRCNALKLGTESNGGFENIAISNCAIYDTRLAGLALEMVDGGVLDGVTVSNLTMNNVGAAIFLRLGNRARPFQAGTPPPGMGQFRNVTIQNVVATVSDDTGCAISGLPGHDIQNVSLGNIKILFPGGGEATLAGREVPEQQAVYPEYKMFGRLPAYGFFCRHVDGLAMRDIDLRWAGQELRPALACDDVKRLELQGFRAQSQLGGSPLLVLRNVQGALITGCSMPSDADVFLQLSGACDQITATGNDLSRAATAFQLDPATVPGALVQSANRLRK